MLFLFDTDGVIDDNKEKIDFMFVYFMARIL